MTKFKPGAPSAIIFFVLMQILIISKIAAPFYFPNMMFIKISCALCPIFIFIFYYFDLKNNLTTSTSLILHDKLVAAGKGRINIFFQLHLPLWFISLIFGLAATATVVYLPAIPTRVYAKEPFMEIAWVANKQCVHNARSFTYYTVLSFVSTNTTYATRLQLNDNCQDAFHLHDRVVFAGRQWWVGAYANNISIDNGLTS